MKKLLLILLIAIASQPAIFATGSEAAAGLVGFGLGMFTGAVASSAPHHHCCYHCRPFFNSLYEENDLLRGSLYETKQLVRALKEDNHELEEEIAELRQENRILRKKLQKEKITPAAATGVRFGVAINAMN
jgi:hypothetical protein